MAFLVSVWVHRVGAGKGHSQTETFSQQGFGSVIGIAGTCKLRAFACITATSRMTDC
jgi:hypothetical protein